VGPIVDGEKYLAPTTWVHLEREAQLDFFPFGMTNPLIYDQITF
jgi:hypothetical protein